MNLDEAAQLLADVVSDLKASGTHPHGGVLGVRLHQALSDRGHAHLHKELGFDKFGQLLHGCSPPLVVRKEPPLLDLIVDVELTSERQGPESLGARLRRWFLAPRDTSPRSAPSHARTTTRRPLSPSRRIKPQIWAAVLSDRVPGATYICHEDRAIRVGARPADGRSWTPIPLMPMKEQAGVVEEIRSQVSNVAHDATRGAIGQALEEAKSSTAPILEFSRTSNSLYSVSRAWHERRVRAVLEWVGRRAPGVPEAAVVSAVREAPRPAGPPAVEVADKLRAEIKHRVDRMPLADLLRLRVLMDAANVK